ncbi:hypothetical protein DK389_25660 [Methylobacterium durans]|uniref:Uncharacterized protein n=2 Tax=Methylobacterium durans TaxID=2202825 RepID=A0A2U8WCV3_9HYPH|nr:hypothetical protein DK389_25660 [Methylobacterium durans]
MPPWNNPAYPQYTWYHPDITPSASSPDFVPPPSRPWPPRLITYDNIDELLAEHAASVFARYGGRRLSPDWIERFSRETNWDGIGPAVAVSWGGVTWLTSGSIARAVARIIAASPARALLRNDEWDAQHEMTISGFPANILSAKGPEERQSRGYVATLTEPVTVLAQHGLGGILRERNPYRRSSTVSDPGGTSALGFSATNVGGVQ